jgi:antitoxin component YwqK of YwqJK toxin-antitoxin module
MRYLTTILFIIIFKTAFSQTNDLDSNILRPSLDIEYEGSTCVIHKMGKTYCEHIGETFHEYVVADGWYSLNPSTGCIISISHYGIPFKDISINGENHFIKYKNGKAVNGKINDVSSDKRYERTDKYTINGTVKNGVLIGEVTTYLNGNKILNGQLKDGKPFGLWKHYYGGTLLLSYYFKENNLCPINITRYYNDTSKLEYSKDYLNGHPYEEIRFYRNGDTLSALKLIDSTKMIYNYVEFHPNGRIMENGKKQLDNPFRKQQNIGTDFRYKKIGVWEYFDENNNLIRKETN